MALTRLTESFYHRDCLEVAPDLVGKLILRKFPDGTLLRERIAETEAYRGQEDLACHASRGRTPRTELLYRESGIIYVYLCYGMHWLMNVITGEPEQPQGVLIRAGAVHNGPAKLTKYLQVDKHFNGGSFVTSRNCGSPTTLPPETAHRCACGHRLRRGVLEKYALAVDR